MTPTPFALSGVPPFLDGVYLATNAVPDARLIVDCPSGCFFKCERIALSHDATSTLFDPLGDHRIVQSGITFTELTLGSESALRPLLRRVVERTRPAALFVTQASPVTLTSNDLGALAEEFTREAGVPVVAITPDTFEGDWLDGWERFTEAVVAALARGPDRGAGAGAGAGHGDPREVVLVGYLADRLEADHRANLAELERLLAGLGLRLTGVACGGTTLRELETALRAPLVVELPYAGAAARRLAERTGATVVRTDLPLGVEGTVRWLETIAAAAGAEAALEPLLERELTSLVPAIEQARARFLRDRRVALAADPALAAGLAGFLAELGVAVPLVAARTRHERRLTGLRQALAEAGGGAAPRLLHDVGVADLTAHLTALPPAERPIALVGSSLERDVARDLDLGFLELGYPAYVTHAFAPRPSLGFAGALRLVDELVTAVQTGEYLRNSAR